MIVHEIKVLIMSDDKEQFYDVSCNTKISLQETSADINTKFKRITVSSLQIKNQFTVNILFWNFSTELSLFMFGISSNNRSISFPYYKLIKSTELLQVCS